MRRFTSIGFNHLALEQLVQLFKNESLVTNPSLSSPPALEPT